MSDEKYAQDERRLTSRLIRYWRDRRGVRAMPQEADIDPDDLGDDWDYCFLLQSRDVANVQDYNFTYLGQKIIRAYHAPALDAFNPVLLGPNASCLSRVFERVITSQAVVYDEGEFLSLQGKRVLYRQCALPLGDEDNGVEAIFGGMNFRIEE